MGEVDLSAIAHNVRALKALTPPGHPLHGGREGRRLRARRRPGCSRRSCRGATDLGVATVDEALVLRDAGFTEPLMLLSEPPIETAEVLLGRRHRSDRDHARVRCGVRKAAMARGTDGAYHLKVDSGMNRIGVRAEDAAEFAYGLKDFPGLGSRAPSPISRLRTFRETGTLSGNSAVRRQRSRTCAPRGSTPGSSTPRTAPPPSCIRSRTSTWSVAASPSTAWSRRSRRGRVDLRPAMSVKARATLVKRIGIGEGVSYGLTWQAAAPSTIATLPLGYADGVHRVLSNAMSVLLGGVRAQQVGRVCMDQFMVEVPRGVPFERGDEAVLVGRRGPAITMEELADLAGTINYELACGFGQRLERVYR